MGPPTTDIAGCRDAHRDLLQSLQGLTDEQARMPSLLPGWTIGHVLSHIARNADSVVRRLDAAAAGEIVDQYPGDRPGREAEIEAGAGRAAVDLVADVRSSADAVERAFDAAPEAVWPRTVRGVSGREGSAAAMVLSRWREVEVHHVDLGLGYSPQRWPEGLVRAWLPEVLVDLGQRADPTAVLAWVLRRGPAPHLARWG